MDFSFLHAADLHLDTPFAGLGALQPAVAAALRDASLSAFDRLVDLAVQRRVAFVLLAGDLYDGPKRGLRAQLRFHRGMERLAAAGIGCFVVHGNHDPLEEGWSALRGFPAGVHVFGAGAPSSVPVVREGRCLAVVHGVSYGRREERENLAAAFRRGPEAVLQIGLLHAHVEGQQGHDPYAPCSLADLAASGLDYWALGHVHDRQILARGPSWVVYPGNLQGRSPKATECGAKGAVLVHVEAGAVAGVEFAPLAPVRFENLRVDAAGVGDLASLERLVLERIRPVLLEPAVEGIVARLEIGGRAALHHDLARGGGEELLASLRDASAGSEPWVHWDRVAVGTSPPVDRAALLARDDFAGELLRRIDALQLREEELAALVEGIDAPLLRGEIARVLQPTDGEERLALLRAAERFALDRLGGEE